MSFVNEIEHFTANQIAYLIRSLFISMSEENLIRLTYLAENNLYC